MWWKCLCVLNFTVFRALKPRQLWQLIKDNDMEYIDLVMSCWKVLEWFLSLLSGLQRDAHPIIQRTKLDCIARPSDRHQQSPERCEHAASRQGYASKQLLNKIRAFQNKITILYITDRELIHFPKLWAITSNDPSLQQHFSHRGFVDVLSKLKGTFECRLTDVNVQKEVINLTENPFHVDISSIRLTITYVCPSNHAVLDKMKKQSCRKTTFSKFNSEIVLATSGVWYLKHVLPWEHMHMSCDSAFSSMNIIQVYQYTVHLEH